MVIDYTDFGNSKKLKRDPAADLEIVRRMLARYLEDQKR
jgi:hypothetical protein